MAGLFSVTPRRRAFRPCKASCSWLKKPRTLVLRRWLNHPTKESLRPATALAATQFLAALAQRSSPAPGSPAPAACLQDSSAGQNRRARSDESPRSILAATYSDVPGE